MVKRFLKMFLASLALAAVAAVPVTMSGNEWVGGVEIGSNSQDGLEIGGVEIGGGATNDGVEIG